MKLFTGNRVYPDKYPYHKNEPKADNVTIVKTHNKGQALASKIFLKPDDLVFRFSGDVINHQTLYTLQKSNGVYINDEYVMGRVLHSCNPNTTVDMNTQEFICTRLISPGEPITMDYETTEDELFRAFECECGAVNCKGFISGRLV